jgi:hypothetical protein
MKVKLKNPEKVYYDREQRATLHGKGIFEVKATLHIRRLIGEGAILEVETNKDELSEADKAKAAEAKLNAEAKAKAEAEAKAKAAAAKNK